MAILRPVEPPPRSAPHADHPPPRDPGLVPLVLRVARLFRCPRAAVTLVAGSDLWVRAGLGVEDDVYARSEALCDIALRSDAPMVIPDLCAVPILTAHPAVSVHRLRFYAGAPLIGDGGVRIGTICAFDARPHDPPTTAAIADLRQLATQAAAMLHAGGAVRPA